MDATTSAFLQQIATNLEPLKALSQHPQIQFMPQFMASAFAIVTALVIVYFMEPWKRWFQKSKIVAEKVIPKYQNGQYLYRLILTNKSNYVAKNVEIEVEDVYDDGGEPRANFVAAPLRWTHRSATPRDIYPHQTVYLDICEVRQEQNKFITLTAPHIMDLPEMVTIRMGKTKVKLKYYQEDGQTGVITLEINWNGNETFKSPDLPKIRVK